MAHLKKCISIDEGLVFWLENEERNNPVYKGFSDILEVFLTKGIQAYEHEKLAEIQIEKGRHGQGEKGSSMRGMSQSHDDDLEDMPVLRDE